MIAPEEVDRHLSPIEQVGQGVHDLQGMIPIGRFRQTVAIEHHQIVGRAGCQTAHRLHHLRHHVHIIEN